MAYKAITINQKKKENSLANVWGRLQKPPTMVAAGAIAAEQTIIH